MLQKHVRSICCELSEALNFGYLWGYDVGAASLVGSQRLVKIQQLLPRLSQYLGWVLSPEPDSWRQLKLDA